MLSKSPSLHGPSLSRLAPSLYMFSLLNLVLVSRATRCDSSSALISVLLSVFCCSLGLGMRASSSPQGTPCGPSQGRFTPLSRLTPGVHTWSRVLVRVSRIWVASDPIKGREFGLDSLLIDGEGVTMQARAEPKDMKRLKQLLVEGKVYAMSNFTVGQKLKWYVACRNGLMIYMKEETVVEEITDGTGSSIPRHSFEFADFGDVPSRNEDRTFYTDVIGQVVCIEDEGRAWKWDAFRNISFLNLYLRDLRGRELNVVLYEDLGRNFDAEQVFKQDRQVPVVAVFAGMLVQWYKGRGFTVRSTSASKYYQDLDIPEVQEFRASLEGSHTPIDRLPCLVQNPMTPDVLANSWRTIKQLTSMNPHELQQRTCFLCRATLKGIDPKDWWYLSCFHCSQSISWDGSNPACIRGCPNDASPVERKVKLNAIIEDETGTMNVMIFDDPAKKLVGVAAKDLVGEVTGDNISAVVCSKQRRAFQVAFGNGCFVLKHILDDDELQLLKSGVHMEDGGLSQDEGSSASCLSDSQAKQEEMVIKEEVEAGGSELSQDEGSSAPCISGSQVKQEEMVIKEEMEAVGGIELPHHEGSCTSCSSSPVKKLRR